MGNILVRMGVVIGVLFCVQLGFSYIFKLNNPVVVAPLRPLEDLPKEIKADSGTWSGKDERLDNQEFNYAQLDGVVTRRYTNHDGRTMSVLLGLYERPAVGLYHNPFNCYHTHSYNLLESGLRPLKADNRTDTDVNLSMWEKDGQRFVVVYWYEVGDHTMFERQDLLATQFAMRGKSKWPPMFKVLIQVPATDPDQAKLDALDMAKSVRQWIGTIQPKVD